MRRSVFSVWSRLTNIERQTRVREAQADYERRFWDRQRDEWMREAIYRTHEKMWNILGRQ